MNSRIHFYITFLFSIFILFIASCEAQNEDNLNNLEDSVKIYTGVIVKENFVDKGGRVYDDAVDYYFKTDEGEVFIKIAAGNVSRDEIRKNLDKKVKVKGKHIYFGLWDTDDPNVQSRVGDYFIFYEIIK